MVFEEGLTRDEGEFIYRMFDANTALDLHFAMFLPTILGQGDREQVCTCSCFVLMWAGESVGHGCG